MSEDWILWFNLLKKSANNALIFNDYYKELTRTRWWKKLPEDERIDFLNNLRDEIKPLLIDPRIFPLPEVVVPKEPEPEPVEEKRDKGTIRFSMYQTDTEAPSTKQPELKPSFNSFIIEHIELEKRKSEIRNEINSLSNFHEKVEYLEHKKSEVRLQYEEANEYQKEFLESVSKPLINYISAQMDYCRSHGKERKAISVELRNYNKPTLKQIQLTLLFKVLYEKRIFANGDLTRKDYAKILSSLTGYSPEPFRQKLSIPYNRITEISDKSNDYDEIVHKLKDVIREIERYRDSIV